MTSKIMSSWISLLGCVTLGYAQSTDSEQQDTLDLYANVEFEIPRVVEPTFPANSVSIADYGAVADGQTLNTQAFAQAIDAVVKQGGGRVEIPRGIWLTGPITLKSNINLHAHPGALVIFSGDVDLYPLVETSFEGLNTIRCISPINGVDLENVAITGPGIFDGSGGAWRPVKQSKLTEKQWEELVASGGVLNEKGDIWYPSAQALRGVSQSTMNVPDLAKNKEAYQSIKDYLRPVMVSIVRSKNILLDGPTFQNSPAWCLHPLMSEHITIRNLTVKNPWFSQNGDGLDLESCKNVLIYNNNFDVGDDAICFKSGKDEDGRARAMPTENVIVKNNIVYHGHGGFVIGSEMSGGVKNVKISDCTFIGTDIGIRFKSTRGRGGVVENIYISDIDMVDIPTEPIRFNMFYGGQSPTETANQEESNPSVPVTEETPSFRNIFMRNITASGAGYAALFQGLPEMNLKNVTLENAVLKAKKGIAMIDADGIVLSNVKILQEKGPSLIIHNSKHIDVTDFSFTKTQEAPVVKVEGKDSQHITLAKANFNDPEKQVVCQQPEDCGVTWKE